MDAIFSALSAANVSLLAWIPLLTLAVGFGVVMWRTKSPHFLIRRFWLLVHGSKDIPDADIRAFLDEQTSLQSFRLFSGVQVRTLEGAKLLMAWCKQHGIPISTVSECCNFFDPDERKVRMDRLPGKGQRTLQALWGSLLIVLLGFSGLFAIYAPGLVQLKATDRWLILSKNEVRRAFSLPLLTNAVDSGDCKTRMPQRIAGSGFSMEEFDIVCDLLQKPEWHPFISDLKEKTRWLFIWLMFTCMGAFYIVFREVSKRLAAQEILERTAPSDTCADVQDAGDQVAPLPQLAMEPAGSS